MGMRRCLHGGRTTTPSSREKGTGREEVQTGIDYICTETSHNAIFM
jgi:hypothetical protein